MSLASRIEGGVSAFRPLLVNIRPKASTAQAHDANHDGVTGHVILTSLTGTHLRSHFGSMSKAEMRCALVSSLAVAPIAAAQSKNSLYSLRLYSVVVACALASLVSFETSLQESPTKSSHLSVLDQWHEQVHWTTSYVIRCFYC